MHTQIMGYATQVSKSDEAKLAVSFPSLPYNIEAPYWVVDTDYDSYAVVWSCYEFGVFHTGMLHLIFRQLTFDVRYNNIIFRRIHYYFYTP